MKLSMLGRKDELSLAVFLGLALSHADKFVPALALKRSSGC